MSSWTPTPAKLRDGETRDVDSHARRNLEMIAQGVKDGILTEEDLSEDRVQELRELMDADEEDTS